jgi:apolipoprotein N-acyltransferase
MPAIIPRPSTALDHDGSRRATPIDVPLLTGMVLERKAPESPAHVHMVNPDGTWREEKAERFNSAVLATPDGRVRGVYDKRELVTFGETIPREDQFPWLRRLLPAAGTFSPGTSSAPLSLAGKRTLAVVLRLQQVATAFRTPRVVTRVTTRHLSPDDRSSLE